MSDDGSYKGSIRVKLGAASVAYRGSMAFVEVDPEARLVRLQGTGRERGGAGSVRMVMESRVVESGAGSEVIVEAEVQLAGKIVRFARGMLQSVSRQVFRQFAACLAELIADDVGGGGEGVPAPPSGQAGLNPARILLRVFANWVRRLFGRGG